jgi:hypothetical protein
MTPEHRNGQIVIERLLEESSAHPVRCLAEAIVSLADNGQIDPVAEGGKEKVAALVSSARALLEITPVPPLH